MRRLVVSVAAVVVLGLGLAGPAGAWSWPTDGVVLRPFSLGPNPYAAGQHRGVDVEGSTGAALRAPITGTVTFAGSVPTHGRTVAILTADGYSVTLAHLGTIAVAKGESVTEGQAVGTVGSSGTPEHGVPYVHLGVRVASQSEGYVDPMGFLPSRAVAPPPSPAAAEPAPAPAPTPAPVASDPTAPATAVPDPAPTPVSSAPAPAPAEPHAAPPASPAPTPSSGPAPEPAPATSGASGPEASARPVVSPQAGPVGDESMRPGSSSLSSPPTPSDGGDRRAAGPGTRAAASGMEGLRGHARPARVVGLVHLARDTTAAAVTPPGGRGSLDGAVWGSPGVVGAVSSGVELAASARDPARVADTAEAIPGVPRARVLSLHSGAPSSIWTSVMLAVALGAATLLLVAARAATRKARRIGGNGAVLPHHADLLRQLDAAHRPCLHDDRRRHLRAASAPARA